MASGPITSWQIEREKVEAVPDFLFLGSKITADGDCSHENKRCLLLASRTMTKLNSVLKSRDTTLPSEAHIVEAMVFPVFMYGCENWTIKKAEHWRIGAFEHSRVAWTARRPNQSILKEISPEYSLERLMLKLKLQYFGHVMRRVNSPEKTLMLGKIESKRIRRQQRMRWLDSITDSMSMNLSKLWKWRTGKPGVLKSTESQCQAWLSDWTTTI